MHRHLKPPGEPTFAAAEDVAARDRRLLAPGAFVAIGGGSALDLAKAARLVAEQGGPLTRFAGGATPIVEPRLPLVTRPDDVGHRLRGLGRRRDDRQGGRSQGRARLARTCAPQHALVDPLLTVGLPPAPTAQTGIDALAQAIGGVIVTNGNPLSMAVGLEACRHVAAVARAAVRDGSNLEARRAMSLASLLAGLSMNLSDCAADHALAQAMGGLPLAAARAHRRGSCWPRRSTCRAPSARRRSSASPTRSASPTTAAATDRAPCAGCDGCSPRSRFRPRREAGLRPEHVDELTPLALEEYFMTVDPHRWTADDVAGRTARRWRWPPGEDDAGGYPDNHNHFVMAGGIDAMVAAAERAGHLGPSPSASTTSTSTRRARRSRTSRRAGRPRARRCRSPLRREGAHGRRDARACRCCSASRWTCGPEDAAFEQATRRVHRDAVTTGTSSSARCTR